MKKYLLTLFLIFGTVVNAYCSPDNSMSITPSATDGTTITASDENTRNNEVSTKFNAHDHNDIDQTANTVNVGDATAGNKTITANNADTNKPFLRYDDTANDWIVSTNGVDPSARLSEHGIAFEGATANDYETTITVTDPTADRTVTLPNVDLNFVTGLPVSVLNAGTGASATTFWRGDATWATGMQYTDTRFTRVSATRDLSTASGTQEITGAGFAPKKVTIIGGVPDGVEASWGFGESGGNGAVISNAYAVLAGTFYEYTASNNVIYFIETASNYQIASISAWGSDGITLSWTKGGSITGTANIAILFER